MRHQNLSMPIFLQNDNLGDSFLHLNVDCQIILTLMKYYTNESVRCKHNYLIQVCCPHSLVTHLSPSSLPLLQARLLPFCLFWSISDNVPPTICHLPVSSQSVWSTLCPLNASRTIELIRKEALQKCDFIQRLWRCTTNSFSCTLSPLTRSFSSLAFVARCLGRPFKVIVALKNHNPDLHGFSFFLETQKVILWVIHTSFVNWIYWFINKKFN